MSFAVGQGVWLLATLTAPGSPCLHEIHWLPRSFLMSQEHPGGIYLRSQNRAEPGEEEGPGQCDQMALSEPVGKKPWDLMKGLSPWGFLPQPTATPASFGWFSQWPRNPPSDLGPAT